MTNTNNRYKVTYLLPSLALLIYSYCQAQTEFPNILNRTEFLRLVLTNDSLFNYRVWQTVSNGKPRKFQAYLQLFKHLSNCSSNKKAIAEAKEILGDIFTQHANHLCCAEYTLGTSVVHYCKPATHKHCFARGVYGCSGDLC